MEHYICTGTCHGQSEKPKNCGDKTCTMYDKPLVPCNCADAKHGKEEKKQEDSKEQGQ